MHIKGTSAIVTGGASGLGEATVRLLHAQGAKVVIADVVEEAGKALAEELGDGVLFSKTDVSSEEDGQNTVQLAVEKHGGVNILVNCAGIGGAMKIVSSRGIFDLKLFDGVVRINLIGTFNMLRLAADAMSKGKPDDGGERGVIINTASVAAFEGQIGQAAYAASKAGIAGLALPAARELCRHGIRVLTIAPGLFDTPMLAKVPEDIRKSLGEQAPFPARLGYPSEYAALVQHLVENPMLNGECIRLDGALRMQAK